MYNIQNKKHIQGGKRMLTNLKKLFMEEEGQGLSEYGLLLAGVVAIVVVAVVLLRDEVQALFTGIIEDIPADTTP
jgi:pilus assembly protein Flp/PilA